MTAIARNTHKIEDLAQTAAGIPTIFDFVIWKNISRIFVASALGLFYLILLHPIYYHLNCFTFVIKIALFIGRVLCI